MNFRLPTAGLRKYTSASQRARVSTEAWGKKNLFCPACESQRLVPAPPGTAVIDYLCPVCYSPYQLKSQSRPIGDKVLDAAYSKMKLAILKDRAPHLFLLHYDLDDWSVRSLILIPRFVFSLAAIERKKPLAPTAKRAGWVGCYILVEALAKISIIADGKTIAPGVVRQHFGRVRPLERIETAQREWALDVLAVVRSLNKKVFSLKEAYSFESRLAHLHPENHHIREKIRQQLQVLRDHGFIEFLGHGEYRLR